MTRFFWRPRRGPHLSALAGLLVFGLLCVALSVASAQAPGAVAPKVLLLITEEVSQTPGAQATVSTWWASLPEPRFTPTDLAIARALEQEGVKVHQPGPEVRVSRVFLVPSLPVANAASLAKLLGAQYVFVGTVRHERTALRGFDAPVAWDTLAQVRLVEAATQKEVLSPLLLRRLVFGQEAEGTLGQAQQQVAQALARMMKGGLGQLAGPVGIARDQERFLVLRAVGQMSQVEAVRARLMGLGEIDEVAIRWASEGQIALEINPGKADDPTRIERAWRTLTQAPFDGFSVRPGTQVQDLYGVALDVVSAGTTPSFSTETR